MSPREQPWKLAPGTLLQTLATAVAIVPWWRVNQMATVGLAEAERRRNARFLIACDANSGEGRFAADEAKSRLTGERRD